MVPAANIGTLCNTRMTSIRTTCSAFSAAAAARSLATVSLRNGIGTPHTQSHHSHPHTHTHLRPCSVLMRGDASVDFCLPSFQFLNRAAAFVVPAQHASFDGNHLQAQWRLSARLGCHRTPASAGGFKNLLLPLLSHRALQRPQRLLCVLRKSQTACCGGIPVAIVTGNGEAVQLCTKQCEVVTALSAETAAG